MGIFLFLNSEKEIKVLRGETKKINGVMVTVSEDGGGHWIMEEGDIPFTEILLEQAGEKEKLNVEGGIQKMWKDYLINIKDVGWDGKYVVLSIKKVGNPKISKDRAIKLAQEYADSHLKIDRSIYMHMSMSDRVGYYAVSIYAHPDKEIEFPTINLNIDKFTGKITEYTEN
jgi:hypothetical protein